MRERWVCVWLMSGVLCQRDAWIRRMLYGVVLCLLSLLRLSYRGTKLLQCFNSPYPNEPKWRNQGRVYTDERYIYRSRLLAIQYLPKDWTRLCTLCHKTCACWILSLLWYLLVFIQPHFPLYECEELSFTHFCNSYKHITFACVQKYLF